MLQCMPDHAGSDLKALHVHTSISVYLTVMPSHWTQTWKLLCFWAERNGTERSCVDINNNDLFVYCKLLSGAQCVVNQECSAARLGIPEDSLPPRFPFPLSHLSHFAIICAGCSRGPIVWDGRAVWLKGGRGMIEALAFGGWGWVGLGKLWWLVALFPLFPVCRSDKVNAGTWRRLASAEYLITFP